MGRSFISQKIESLLPHFKLIINKNMEKINEHDDGANKHQDNKNGNG